MGQLPEDLLYQIFEYLPLDIKIQVGGIFLRRYEARNIQRLMTSNGYEYRLDGQLHRSDGPAQIQYFSNGSVYREQWFLHDKPHRSDGPAEISYYSTGQIGYQGWYNYGSRRDHGPVEIWYNPNGVILYKN